uniref:Uncharacterized protein n=1 Tax=Romanomermis culicivorax TaxID=13658 RepID=A0A915IZ40_ROMCU
MSIEHSKKIVFGTEGAEKLLSTVNPFSDSNFKKSTRPKTTEQNGMQSMETLQLLSLKAEVKNNFGVGRFGGMAGAVAPSIETEHTRKM